MSIAQAQDNGAVKHKSIGFPDPADGLNRQELVEYWRIILKRKWLIALFGFSMALLAVVIVLAMTPIYRATTTVMIESSKHKVLSIDEVYGGAAPTREFFQTQVEIIKSRDVLLKAIKKLELWDQPEFDPRLPKTGIVAAILDRIGFNDDLETPDWNEGTLADAVLSSIVAGLTAEPVRLSQLVKISFDSPNASLAASVANAIAESYIENDLDARYQMTTNANAWVNARTVAMKARLDDSEKELQAYRDRAGLVDIKTMGQSGAALQFGEITRRLVETRLRRAETENAYQQIKNAGKGADLSSLPGVIRNPGVIGAKSQEANAQLRLTEVSERYGKEHPKYIQAEAELRSARDNVQREVKNVVDSITHEYEVARGIEKTLEGSLAASKGGIRDINRKEFDLNLLEREVESNRQMYNMLMMRSKEMDVSVDLLTTVGRVVEAAIQPKIPYKPKKGVIVLVALVLGLFVGVLSALLIDRLDNTIKNTDDVEAKIREPLLTTLPKLTKDDIGKGEVGRIFADKPNSLYAEAVRTARTGVLLSAIDLPNRVLVVTSSLPDEGKTTFSINLALAHAHTKRTLLIDADLRRAQVGKSLGLAMDAKGLSNMVSGTAKLSECVVRVPDSNLLIMPAGAIPPNPLELLLSNRFKETIARLTKEFEIIVIDTPPVGLVSDALVISNLATGVLYVVRAESTPYQLARKGIARIKQAEGAVLGVVLNRLDFEKAEKYYGEYSGYSTYGARKYGYKGAYGMAYPSKKT
jgi:capsular exopolysaccharide synthesis family protein